MPPLEFVYQSLGALRQAFPRQRTFVWFCAVVLGFIAAGQVMGVSSLCRVWGMGGSGYLGLLHFFHSSGWSAASLAMHWQSLVLRQAPLLKISGRAVLHADHTDDPKDGTRMPGVVTLHQESETQSRPSYFRGHQWGAFGVLCGSVTRTFCLPLGAAIHQGLVHLLKDKQDKIAAETLCTRLVEMALSFAVRSNVPSYLVLDAFFSVGPVFTLAGSVWSVALKQPYLYILTRAKKSYVAYFKAKHPKKRGRGRPRKYGEKLKLSEVFEKYRDQFTSRACQVYGKIEMVSYFSLNLLWKPLGEELRFIFAVTSRGPIILMCSNLHIHPTTAIELYCTRVRIETLFWVLKHVLGAFCYRFWSLSLPRHSRKPKKNSTLQSPSVEALPSVARCWEAIERFAQCGLIAAGLLQLVALRFPLTIWERFTLFLRTRSRVLPSEHTVKDVLGPALLKDFRQAAPSAILREIRQLFDPATEAPQSELLQA
jgi:DDE superfamily endonuclease